MIYRVAAVSFLNTVPLVEGLREAPDSRVELSFELPSRVPARLEDGTADVGLIPVVEVLRGRSAGLLAGTGIACRGPVDSVKLFHHGPLEQLRGVRADRGSRSSVALLRVLLAERGLPEPVFETCEPVAGMDIPVGQGVLVIGDRCFACDRALAESPQPGVAALDLGAAWFEATGLPFVFAAWGVSRTFAAAAGPDAIAELAGLLADSRDFGLARLDEIAAREAARGRLGHKGEATAAAVAYYFRRSLVYRLGDEEMAGLARFHELCMHHGVVPPGSAPSIIRG